MRGSSSWGKCRTVAAVVVAAVLSSLIGSACSTLSGRSATVERQDADPPVLDLAAPQDETPPHGDARPLDDARRQPEAGVVPTGSAGGRSASDVTAVGDAHGLPAFDLAPSEHAPSSAGPGSADPPAAVADEGPHRGDRPSGNRGRVGVPGAAELVHRLGGDRLAVALEAAAAVPAHWSERLAGWQIRFLEGRTGYRGMTYPDAELIEVYVRPGDDASIVAHVYAHEVGHALDVTSLGDVERAIWSAARGFGEDRPWWPAEGALDFETGSGDLAESFAWLTTGQRHWFGRLGPPPDVAQTLLLSALLGGVVKP